MERLKADDLRILIAVANSGRLVTAAASLGLDHTTVSRRIRALERNFPSRLVVRDSDGWTLTALGQTVLEHALPIETALERVAGAALSSEADALSGVLRVTAPDGFGAYFVAPALAKLHSKHPALQFELVTATRQVGVRQSGFDLAVTIGSPESIRLVSEALTQYALGLYASPDYLERFGVPANLDELRAHSVIFYIDSFLQVDDLDLATHLPGITPKITSTNLVAQLEATSAGGGIGVLPKFIACRDSSLRQVLPSNFGMMLSFTLSARRGSADRPAVLATRKAIKDEVQRRQDELI